LNPGQSVTITATVAPATGGVPTGSVVFLDNGTALQTVALVNGAASFATTLSAGSTHALTVSYAGDANFVGSASTASPVSITVAPLDFSVGSSTSALTLALTAGGSGSVTFQVTPTYGSFPSTVNFTVKGLPTGATATFSPSSFAANSAGGQVTLTVQMPKQTAQQRTGELMLAALPAGLLALLGLKRRRVPMLFALLLMLGLAGLQGCGSSAPAINSYSATITGTSGTISHDQALTVNVTH